MYQYIVIRKGWQLDCTAFVSNLTIEEIPDFNFIRFLLDKDGDKLYLTTGVYIFYTQKKDDIVNSVYIYRGHFFKKSFHTRN